MTGNEVCGCRTSVNVLGFSTMEPVVSIVKCSMHGGSLTPFKYQSPEKGLF